MNVAYTLFLSTDNNMYFDLQSYRAFSNLVFGNGQWYLIDNLPSGGDIFTGMIDDVAIWTRALSADEIHAIYTSSHQL